MVAGESYNGTNYDFALVRYNNTITTSVPVLTNETGLHVYPNPNNGIFTLIANEGKQVQLSITNVVGKTIYSLQITSEKTEIDLSHQCKGIYFIQVNSEKGNSIQKLIIHKYKPLIGVLDACCFYWKRSVTEIFVLMRPFVTALEKIKNCS